MSTTVKRDPFARGEYRRESIPGNDHFAGIERKRTCHWCGNHKKTLFAYAWESDGQMRNTVVDTSKVFCNFECFQAYNS